MPENPTFIELPIYGLPEDTDLTAFHPLVWKVASSLEEMGVFDQREFEPAHIFTVHKGCSP